MKAWTAVGTYQQRETAPILAAVRPLVVEVERAIRFAAGMSGGIHNSRRSALGPPFHLMFR